LIVETPNPLSPFALAVFHTDPTHISRFRPNECAGPIEAASPRQATLAGRAQVMRPMSAD
jgi:hypothetical protein